MGMFKQLHSENLNQLRSLLAVKSPVWFHADGNMYIGERESNNHKLYTNFNPEGTNHPANTGARYRYKFSVASQVPDNLDTMERLFIENKQAEDVIASEPANPNKNFVFKTESAPAPAAKTIDVKEDTGTGKPVKGAAAKAAEVAAVTGEPAKS